jgi:hypothetical protein
MNKLLAETVAILNGFAALTTIIACVVLGKYAGPIFASYYIPTYNHAQAETLGVIVGLLTGFILAVVYNGILALFIQMHRELKAIRQQLIDTKPLQAPTSQVRVVPRMPALAA